MWLLRIYNILFFKINHIIFSPRPHTPSAAYLLTSITKMSPEAAGSILFSKVFRPTRASLAAR